MSKLLIVHLLDTIKFSGFIYLFYNILENQNQTEKEMHKEH